MLYYFISRMIIMGIMWLGMVLLKWGGDGSQLVWQALIFTVIVLMGGFAEKVLHYEGDPYVLPVVQAILALGLVFLVRISPVIGLRQFWWANIGQLIFYGILFAVRDYRQLGKFRYLWGLLAVSLLFITLVFGFAAGGATSWLRIGGVGVEPEEFVKLALLLFMATYLEENEELLRVGTVQVGKFSLPDWRTLGPFLVMAVFSLGLLGAQKSLGTALVFYALFVLMIYVVTERALYLGISLPYFFIGGQLGVSAFQACPRQGDSLAESVARSHGHGISDCSILVCHQRWEDLGYGIRQRHRGCDGSCVKYRLHFLCDSGRAWFCRSHGRSSSLSHRGYEGVFH